MIFKNFLQISAAFYHTISFGHRFYCNSVTNMSVSTIKNNARIALCQIKVTSEKLYNIENAKLAISKASDGNADLAVLPEIWNSPYSTTSFPIYAELVPNVGENTSNLLNSPSIKMLIEKSKEHKIWIIGGSIPEREISLNGEERLYNTCIVVNPEGEIVAKHRKVHLFDIDVPGKIKFKESDSLTSGSDVTVFSSPWGNIGLGICYDIRFPELAILMRMRGCRMLVYPGAFNMVTGPAHWELLQRARAVDNQVFVATCSPARDESGSYIAWGHSSIISPWGDVIASAKADEEVVFGDLDFEKAESMRMNIPCWFQKRHDIYEVIDKGNKL